LTEDFIEVQSESGAKGFNVGILRIYLVLLVEKVNEKKIGMRHSIANIKKQDLR